ncbi:hypothetical protein BDW74DRAFT_176801 [Aspergillus multicolor]|uniref:uncharacterized protein n=1 Tax=Aspergillus multicolor TaxID=41759 RepID=UPI003CCD875A
MADFKANEIRPLESIYHELLYRSWTETLSFFSFRSNAILTSLRVDIASSRENRHSRPEAFKRSAGIWQYLVSQAPEIKLDIRIASVLEMHPPLAHFVSQVGDSICRAKMWTDLGLAVFYKSCIYEPEQSSPTFVLSFGLQKRLGPEQRTAALRLPKVLRDASDAIPPTDVPTFRITAIDARMDYSHEDKRRRRPSQTRQRQRNHLIQATEFNNWDRYWTYHLPNGVPFLEEADDPLLQNDIEELDAGWGDPAHTDPEMSTRTELGTLFREGLRTLVLGAGLGRRRRSQTSADTFHSLSGIAPSVFKLGYREAMNQRSRLISSIVKSLTSLVTRSNGQTLKDKFATTEPVLNSSSHTSLSPRNNNLKTINKTRLWTMAQKQLYSTPIPKHLKHSSNQLPGSDSGEEAQHENLLSETMTEGLAYIGDDPIDADDGLNFSSEICSDGSEHSLIFDYEESDDEYDSIMILEDSNTTRPAPIPEKYLEDLALRSNFPALSKYKINITSPESRTSSGPLSITSQDRPGTDQDMLDVDSESVKGFPSHPSQESSINAHHEEYQAFIDLCESHLYLNQRWASFLDSPPTGRSSHLSGENDFDMLCDNL